MANIKLVFYGNENCDGTELTTGVNFRGELFIFLTDKDGYDSYITLDKSTAIKFAKTLRTEINTMDNERLD